MVARNKEEDMRIICLIGVVMTLMGCVSNDSYLLRFEFSDGFRGWAIVEYGSQKCQPLVIDNDTYVVSFDNLGTACTSTQYPDGWHKSIFVYSDSATEITYVDEEPDDDTIKIWENFLSPKNGKCVKQFLFLGNKEEHKRSLRTQLDKGPC